MKSYPTKLIAPLLLLAAATVPSAAQDETDALRFSLLQPQGTARSIGIGSALGSIGGDFSSLSVNPAGIGIYRRSEFMVTPSLMFNRTSSNYGGPDQTNSGAHFAFSNIGIVWAKAEQGRRYERNKWKAVSFGIGLNRLADFTRNFSYQRTTNTSSASEVFADDANYTNYNPSSEDFSSPGFLGYETYLIDRMQNGLYGTFVNYNTGVRQMNTVKERGGINELAFSVGGNYQERLMLGATVGIPILRFRRNKSFEERDISGLSNNNFEYFTYNEELRTSGMGINLKLGAIYKPTDAFRIGAAIHTPTAFSLTDIMNANLTAHTENLKADTFQNFMDGPVSTAEAETREYTYSLNTPWRAVVSASAIFGSMGFFTVDYEYVDYRSARFKFSDVAADQAYQQVINGIIRNSYRSASNIRAGLEIRLDALALRGGFGYYGNPYQDNGGTDGRRLAFSAGVGYRINSFFLDFGFVHNRFKHSDVPYTLDRIAIPAADVATAQNNAALTVGWKF